jgi:hypothetical protein
MMMGVAQVIGMKPTASFFFSRGAPWAKADRGHDREDFSQCGGCGGTAHCPQEGTSRLRLGHDRAQKGVLDAGLETLLRG